MLERPRFREEVSVSLGSRSRQTVGRAPRNSETRDDYYQEHEGSAGHRSEAELKQGVVELHRSSVD
jgi:hypothetical protein